MQKKNQLLAALALGLLAGPMAAQAQYDFQLIDQPGAPLSDPRVTAETFLRNYFRGPR